MQLQGRLRLKVAVGTLLVAVVSAVAFPTVLHAQDKPHDFKDIIAVVQVHTEGECFKHPNGVQECPAFRVYYGKREIGVFQIDYHKKNHQTFEIVTNVKDTYQPAPRDVKIEFTNDKYTETEDSNLRIKHIDLSILSSPESYGCEDGNYSCRNEYVKGWQQVDYHKKTTVMDTQDAYGYEGEFRDMPIMYYFKNHQYSPNSEQGVGWMHWNGTVRYIKNL